MLLAGAAMLLVAALIAGSLAWRQAKRADRATVVADAGRVAALAHNVTQVDRSLLLAVAAAHLDNSPDTRASLLAALARRPALVGATTDPKLATSIDVNPASGEVAVGGVNVSLYEAGTLGRLASADLTTRQLAFRPDGRQLAIANNDLLDTRRVRLVDADTLKDVPVQLGSVAAPPLAAWSLNYSSDGRALAGLFDLPPATDNESPEESVVWDLAAPQEPIRRIETDNAWAVALSPDGQRLYVGEQTRPQNTAVRASASVYDVVTGRRLRSVYLPFDSHWLGPTGSSGLLDLSPDGTTLAAADGGEIVLLDASTLALKRRLTGPPERVQTVQFSHDGTMVASGSDHGMVLVWDVAAGRLEELQGDAGPVSDLAFSPDDSLLYSAADKLLAWDLGGGHRFVHRLAQPVRDDSFSSRAVPAPDGEAVAYFASSGPVAHHSTIQFRNVATGRLGEPIVTATESSGAAWRPPPKAEQFATTGGEGARAGVELAPQRAGRRSGKVARGTRRGESPTAPTAGGSSSPNGRARSSRSTPTPSNRSVTGSNPAPTSSRSSRPPTPSTALVLPAGELLRTGRPRSTGPSSQDRPRRRPHIGRHLTGRHPPRRRHRQGPRRGRRHPRPASGFELARRRPRRHGSKPSRGRPTAPPSSAPATTAGSSCGTVRTGEPLAAIAPGTPDVWAAGEFLLRRSHGARRHT